MMGHVIFTLSNIEKERLSAKCISIKTKSGIRLLLNHSILSLTDCNTPMTTASGISSFNKPTSFLAVSCSSSMIITLMVYTVLGASNTKGKVTLNSLSVCSIVMFFCHFNIYRSDKFAKPMPAPALDIGLG